MAVFEMNREEIEATKLAVRRLDIHNLSSKRTLIKCIQMMLDLYIKEKQKNYLYAAIARIQAYLELGFCYDDEAELFDYILELSGTSKIEQFPKRTYKAKRIAATYAQVDIVLKRWYGVRGQSKKDVINDILDKVKNHLTGSYEYRNSNVSNKTNTEILYVLYVEEEEQLLYDVERDVFYTFEKC